MLRQASFYEPGGELRKAALLLRNLGGVTSLADGSRLADEHGALWLAAVDAGAPERPGAWEPPRAPDPSTVEDTAGSDGEASDDDGSDSGEESAPEDALARIHLRDAERTFALPANRARLVHLLRALAEDSDGDYNQALAATVGFLMLAIDSDRDILRAVRHLFLPFYGLRTAISARPVLMNADGRIAHSLLPARFPGVAAQLDRLGAGPSTYYQRLRIAVGVTSLPFPALFPAIDGLFAHGEMRRYRTF